MHLRRVASWRARTCGAIALSVGLAATGPVVQPAHAEVTFTWAAVGHTGNAADPLNSGTRPGIGAVNDQYRISTTEVTNTQYVEYLNIVDPAGSNPNGVYNNNMNISPRGGIVFTAAAPNGQKYATKPNFSNKPLNYVSFPDAMRFVNWLHNGQVAGGTETGVYAIDDGVSEVRTPGARYFIPSESEWYKAAYYDPTPGAGGGDNYWRYPTASDSAPTIASATAIGDIANPGANVANYLSGAIWNFAGGNVTTVGSAGSLSASFFGTFDQGGNVAEWNEAVVGGARTHRGGGWNSGPPAISSTNFGGDVVEQPYIGFRVASPIPEPGCAALLALGGLVGARLRHLTSDATAE